MAKKIGGLGKGLGAFGLGGGVSKSLANSVRHVEAAPSAGGDKAGFVQQPVMELDLKLISANPSQPRTEFEPEAMESLRDSVKQYGVLQPVLVRKTTKGYELIAGERRFRAAQLAGLRTIPAMVREYNDAQMTEVALIENIQRENLNPVEEARAYQHLLSDYGLTQEMLSGKVGRSRSHIANFLRLLRLSERVQERLAEGSISMGQAKPLLALEDVALQDKAAEFIIANELSARRAEELVKKLQKHPDCLDGAEKNTPESVPEAEDIFYREAQDRLKLLLGTTVRIKHSGSKKRLEIDFASQDELNYVIRLLERLEQQHAGQMEPGDNDERLAKLRQFSTTGKFSV
ncbi:MAG: ParB/RepB/Spo0J family partition protein [Anaerovibrio sp.]|uniref:ParB/RepB/Spo0J family partition protein n=1 Tax=Anaerovibrio sp. TaxID=1872532 RepID=UPI00260F428D|nr:ParB/RepB/Spo0J family partition protein [Anaerovibrio sp.]MDD7678103.1 ParB/RepB/Spo0J family partition protein [Anaerovibrio sp.]MDY2604024.1 ParB/RepB/Spo0J family partition protein [Anaerovibrio sp.]